MNEQALKSTFARVMQESAEPILRFPWADKYHYAHWLGQTYYFLCHATRMLCLAAAHCSLDVDRRLHLACMEHAQDEKNHEQLALNDLEQLGYSLDAFPELPDTAQLYQSQYYLIEHVNPAALYGSILYLEGLASTIGPEVLQRVTNSHGQAAVAFLYEHVSLDKEHIKKALDVASQCRPEQLSSIIWSLRQKKTIYLHILESISQTSLTRERS